MFLGSEKRDQMIEAIDFVASEYQLMVFEQVDTVLIDIDLQQGVVWMYGQFIVIREGYDVISEFPVGFIGFGGPILAFVQDTLHTRMRMKIGSFPACAGFPPPLYGLKMSGPLNGFGSLKSYMGLTLVTKTAKRAISMSATTVLSSATDIFRCIEFRIRSLKIDQS